jgi:hypothetical protein
MNVRCRYNRQVTPPAPFVHIHVSRPDNLEVAISGVPAQLDSGADMSVIPTRPVEQLQLVQLNQVPITGFGGHVTLAPTHLVGLALRPLETVVVIWPCLCGRKKMLNQIPAMPIRIADEGSGASEKM